MAQRIKLMGPGLTVYRRTGHCRTTVAKDIVQMLSSLCTTSNACAIAVEFDGTTINTNLTFVTYISVLGNSCCQIILCIVTNMKTERWLPDVDANIAAVFYRALLRKHKIGAMGTPLVLPT